MNNIIEVTHLTKTYGKHRGIQDVTFSLSEGEVFGFLGPNGAGKTTTIRILMGLLRPTSGSSTIAGLDCWSQSTAVKRLVGYLPGEFAFDPDMTGAQILAYLGHLRGGVDQKYVRELVERLELDPSKRFRQYSRGNKQKIGLVQAFMHKPHLLILDEPTSGLDPINQQEFYKMVTEAHENGGTVLVSSHILPEVEHICQRVGIIRAGSLIQVNEVQALKNFKQSYIELTFAERAEPAWFNDLSDVSAVEVINDGRTLRLTVQGSSQMLLQRAAQHNAIHITTREPNLEEIFLRFYEPANQ